MGDTMARIVHRSGKATLGRVPGVQQSHAAGGGAPMSPTSRHDVNDVRTRVHSAPDCVNITSFTLGRCA